MTFRSVPFSEISSCPHHKLSAGHYIPIHRTWECKLNGSDTEASALFQKHYSVKTTNTDAELKDAFTKAFKKEHPTWEIKEVVVANG